MKILIISTGIGPWPNDGWGACENLTHELSNCLKDLGHSVFIYHSPDNSRLKGFITSCMPDIVHCEYDDYIHWLIPLKLEFPNVEFRFTNHYAYLTNAQMRSSTGYVRYFNDAIAATKLGIQFYCLSPEIASEFVRCGADPANIRVFHNGASSSITFNAISVKNKAVCLAKIERRKGQQYLTDMNVDFAGPIHDTWIPLQNDQYVGHWSRKNTFERLTDYSALVLLSDGEAHPLVVCEAMMAGLSLVISRVASANLDTAKPWIHIVEESEFTNKEQISKLIDEAIRNNSQYRNDIRNYALENFSWDSIAKKY